MADDKGTKGKGGGDKGGNAPDTPLEVAASMVIERLMRVVGSRAADFLPDSLRTQVMRMARGRNLATAIRVLGRGAEIFGDDEEIRGAIRGFTDGIAGGFVTIDGDGKDVPGKMQAALDANPELKRLEDLKKAGRFDGHRAMPFTEALTYLSPAQRAAIVGILPFLKDGGVFLDAKFLPRELQGLADLIIERGGPSEETAILLKRRFNPTSQVEKALNIFERVRESVKKHLRMAEDGHGGASFTAKVKAGTSAGATGHDRYLKAMTRLQRRPGLMAGAGAFFRSVTDTVKGWFRPPPPPTPGPGAGGSPPAAP